ncbi:MAG: tRNA pseudouridine(38-40) synthase TruA [Bacteroidota bacterium]
MIRYYLLISYRGTAYHGWQRQPNALTVQHCIDEALSTLLRVPTLSHGCGRTDAGVHAMQFYVQFDASVCIENNEKFIYQLNAILPKDIVIADLIKVHHDADARFDANMRTYRYFCLRKKHAFVQDFAWYYPHPLDFEVMNEAANIAMGTHHFTCFYKQANPELSHLCTVSNAMWIYNNPNIFYFEVSANRFLRNMVRAMVGSLMAVGRGAHTIADFEALLKNGIRSDAGKSVPAHGLYLYEVRYPYIPRAKPDSSLFNLHS